MAATVPNGGFLERARFGLIIALLLGGACRRSERRTAFAIPGDRAPRIRVEVLNASGKSGLARTGARVLRQAGIDVVNFATAADTLDSTRILVRRGGPSIGDRVRRALAVGKVVVALDTTALLDASVLLGRDFAPRLDFHP